MNILIIRAFVIMRELPATHKAPAAKMDQVEEGQERQARTATARENQKPAHHPRHRLYWP
jgi:hypothetical protein